MNITDLVRTMNQKAAFELVEQSDTATQLRLLGRIPLDPAGRNMENWRMLARQVLLRSAKAPWKADISKVLLVRNEDLHFAWRVILQGEGLEQHLPEIVQVMAGSPPPVQREVMEMTIPGVTADRNSTVGGRRGAGPVDRVPIGPMAVHAKQMGQ